MIGNVLLDTGPLIAMLDRRGRHHAWVVEQLGQIVPPLLACDAVLTKACYLAVIGNLPPRTGRPAAEPLELVTGGAIQSVFDLGKNAAEGSALMTQYADEPMSLADACLVRMSELISDCTVLTQDSDFRICRRHRRQKIPLRMPDGL